MATPYYKVIMTTRERYDEYGDQIDITQDVELTDYIQAGGISTMKVEADDGDYTIGVFVIGSLTLKAVNHNGEFCDETNWRSLFPYSRDLTKIDVVYVDKTGTENTRFKGLITEDATKEDLLKSTTTFKVLNQQGILRKTTIFPGTVRKGMTFTEAFFGILNRPPITDILNFDINNINPQLDYTIDEELFFDGISAYEGVKALLQASNSVMTIDGSNNMIIRTRTANSNTPYAFYNGADLYGRENIIDLKKYNTGLQRAYNTITIGDFTHIDEEFSLIHGGKQKEIDLPFITERRKSLLIAKAIVDEFKVPKYEMELTVRTEIVKDIDMFDLCTVELGRRVEEYRGEDIPLYEHSEYGTATYPSEFGNLTLPSGMGFKVTAIRENPSNHTTQLRLRQIGITTGDGFI